MADEPKQPATVVQDDFFDLANRPSQIAPPPAELNPNDALILPCGGTKDPASCAMEAYKRYVGPTWNETRKALGGEGFPNYQDKSQNIPQALKNMGVDMYVLSAEYGLIPADTLIENYDRRMTPDRREEIKADKNLSQTISDTLSQYNPEKIHLGTPKDYTKLITDVMGRDYKSVFPKGSGQGSQKKGVVDFLKLRLLEDASKATGQELIPFGEDPSQPVLPMDEKKSKEGVSSKVWKGIGALARKRIPIMEIISAAQGAWNDLDPKTRKEVSNFMETPFYELLGMEKEGIDYFRNLVGLPPGGIADVVDDPMGDMSRQLDIVNDTILKEDYETKEKVKNEGIGGLFDFDFGEGSSEVQKTKQAQDFELRRKQGIMDKAANPFETKQVRRGGMTEDRSYKLPSDPLFEVSEVELGNQNKPRSGQAARSSKFRELMGDDPKLSEGDLPRGYSKRDEEYLREQGLLYEKPSSPKSNYFAEPLDPPVEIPEFDRGPAGQVIGDIQNQSFQLENLDPNETGIKNPLFGKNQPPVSPLSYLDENGSVKEFYIGILSSENLKKFHSGDPFLEPLLRYPENPLLGVKEVSKKYLSHQRDVLASYERNIENINGRIKNMIENPVSYGLDMNAVTEDIEGYRKFSIPSINKRIEEIKNEIEKIQQLTGS